MAFLLVYFDRSADTGITVVAGYVSTPEHWQNFQEEWLEWLARPEYQVPYFHMREFANSVGAYEDGWKGQHRKRREFLQGLISITKSHTFHSFAASVRSDDFGRFIKIRHMERLFGNEFTLCARACGRDVRKWAGVNFPTSPIEYVFECGDEGKGKLIEIMERDGFKTPIFKSKKPSPADPQGMFTPFQAADFLAWEVRKSLGQVESKSGVEWDDLRQSFKELSFGPGSWNHHSAQMLEETAQLHLSDPTVRLPSDK
jgi:hypothetical protein